MSLLVINPTPSRRKRATRTTKAKPKTAVSKGVTTMAKRRRSAAQVAATRRMLAANRRHRNPSSRKATTRRRVRRNPSSVSYRRRIRRNPSTVGSNKGLLGELMSKDGLMMIAAVMGTPTLTTLAAQYLLPNTLTGTTRTAAKAAIGLGLGWAVHKYVNKKAGMIVALVSAGSAAAELINQYTSPSLPGAPGSVAASQATAQGYMRGYKGMQSLSGYASEPGVR